MSMHGGARRSDVASPSQRLSALDALRGLAALAVVMLHFTTDFNRIYQPANPVPLDFPYGAYGVQLFFVISGFVISATTNRVATVGEFAWARFCRLFPVYWASLLLTYVVLLWADIPNAPDAMALTRRLLMNVIMIESWLGVAPLDGVYWTLHIEMSFYIIMATLLAVGRKNDAVKALLGITVISVVDRAFFGVTVAGVHQTWRDITMSGYAQLFLAGMVIQRARDQYQQRDGFILMCCAGAILLFASQGQAMWRDFSAGLISMAMVYAASAGWLSALAVKPLLFLGSISYALYLVHHWLGTALLLHLGRVGVEPVLGLVLAVALVVAVAWLLTEYIQEPALAKMRARREHGRP